MTMSHAVPKLQPSSIKFDTRDTPSPSCVLRWPELQPGHKYMPLHGHAYIKLWLEELN